MLAPGQPQAQDPGKAKASPLATLLSRQLVRLAQICSPGYLIDRPISVAANRSAPAPRGSLSHDMCEVR